MRAGRLTPDCDVRLIGSEKWRSALSIKSLFQSSEHRVEADEPSGRQKQDLPQDGTPVETADIPSAARSWLLLAGICLVCILLAITTWQGYQESHRPSSSSSTTGNNFWGSGLVYLFSTPIIGGLLLYFVISAIVQAPGRMMRIKFAGLGKLAGKSINEIVAVAGPPNATSAIGDGSRLYQWMANGYHIALVFEGEKCIGISHETNV